MILVALTDIHGRTARLPEIAPELEKADLLILSGDITNFGREADAEEVVENIRRYNRNIYAVPGNCDYPGVGSYLSREGMNLHGRCISFGQLALVGLGGSLPTPAHSTPNEYPEKDLSFFLDEASWYIPPDKQLIFVSHQPPWNTRCDVAQGMWVGSSSVRRFIEKQQPTICFTGHIHESRCIDSIGRTKIINPGPFGDGTFAKVELDRERVSVLLMHDSRVIGRA